MLYIKSKNLYWKNDGKGFNGLLFAFFSSALIVLGVISPAVTLIAFCLCAGYLCVTKTEENYYFMFFMIPFANIFKISEESSSFFTYLCLIFIIKQVFLTKEINANFILVFLVYVLYLLFGAFNNITMLIKQAMIPLIVYFFFKNSKSDFKKVCLYFVYGLIFSSLIAYFKDIIPNMDAYIKFERAYEVEGDVTRFTGLYSDPNFYSVALITAFISLALLLFYKKVKYEAFIALILFVIFGFQTISKSFFLMLGVVLVLFGILLFRNKKALWGLFYSISLIIVVYLVLGGYIGFTDNIMARFKEGADLTTGRVDIWVTYREYLSQNLLRLSFGAGMGAPELGNASHNTYIDFLYYYGIIGTILFLFVCYLASRQTRKNKKTLVNIIPAACVITMMVFLSALQSFDFPFILILIIYAYQIKFDKEEFCQDNTIKTIK